MASNQNQSTAPADKEKEQLLKKIEELEKANAESQKRAEAAEKESAEAKEALTALQSAAAKKDEPAAAEERVDVFVPKGYANDEPNLFIAVNGVNYLLPKGKKSTVPKHVAEEYYRSVKAQQIQDDNIKSMRTKE